MLYQPAPWTLPTEGEHSPSPTLSVQPVAESFPLSRSLTILAFLFSHTAAQTMMPSCVFTPGSVTFHSFFLLAWCLPVSLPSPGLPRSLLTRVAFHPRISLLPSSQHISLPHTCPWPFPPDWPVFVTPRPGTQHTRFLELHPLPLVLAITAIICHPGFSVFCVTSPVS